MQPHTYQCWSFLNIYSERHRSHFILFPSCFIRSARDFVLGWPQIRFCPNTSPDTPYSTSVIQTPSDPALLEYPQWNKTFPAPPTCWGIFSWNWMHIPVAGEAPVRMWVWWDLCFSNAKCFCSLSFQIKGGGQLSSHSSQGGSVLFHKEQLYFPLPILLLLQKRDNLWLHQGTRHPLCCCRLPHRKNADNNLLKQASLLLKGMTLPYLLQQSTLHIILQDWFRTDSASHPLHNWE